MLNIKRYKTREPSLHFHIHLQHSRTHIHTHANKHTQAMCMYASVRVRCVCVCDACEHTVLDFGFRNCTRKNTCCSCIVALALTHLYSWSARSIIDWCCFYYFVRNSLVALLEALRARSVSASTIFASNTFGRLAYRWFAVSHRYANVKRWWWWLLLLLSKVV